VAFTYNGDPSESAVAQVRFLVGDTVQTAFSMTDAEVQFALNSSKSSDGTFRYREAAATICEAISTKYAREATKSKSVGDLKITSDYTTAAKDFLDLADRLRTQAGGSATFPGVSALMAPDPNTGAETRETTFALGMHDDNADNTPTSAISDFPDF